MSTREATPYAAARILGDDGYVALTLDRLADGLGVRPPSIYHHVHSRDELVAEVMARGFDKSCESLEETLGPVGLSQPLRRLEVTIAAAADGIEVYAPLPPPACATSISV